MPSDDDEGGMEALAGSGSECIGDDGWRSVAVLVASSGGQWPGSRLISVILNWNEWVTLKGAGMGL